MPSRTIAQRPDPSNPKRDSTVRGKRMALRRNKIVVLSGVALVAIAGAALSYTVSRPTTPVADSRGSAVVDECRAALGHDASQSAQDVAWLKHCISALTPDSNGHTSSPPASPPQASPTVTGPVATTNPPVKVTTTRAGNPVPGSSFNGKSINTGNTGYLNWVGTKGERCTDATLKVYASKVNASQLGNATCVWLKGGINVDKPVTLTAARIETQVRTYGERLTLNWCTVNADGGDQAVDGRVDTLRCQLINASDGVRFDGTNIVETYIRVKQQNSQDHNDGIQAYKAGQGGSILRSNIDSRPVGAPRSILGNAAIFIADGSRGEVVIRDNYLAGGEYTLRMHEAATYRLSGNIIADYNSAPIATDSAISGAFLEFSNNHTASGQLINLR